MRISAWDDRCGEAPFPRVSRVVYCATSDSLTVTEYSPTCSSASGGYRRG